jgi:hypothetical protein
MTYTFTMTDNKSSQTAALTSDALPCKPNPPRHILVAEGIAVTYRPHIEVLTGSGFHLDAAEEKVVAWQTRLASNQHRKSRSAEHRLRRDPSGCHGRVSAKF